MKRIAAAFLLAYAVVLTSCCAGVMSDAALEIPTLPDAPARPGWPAFLVLQPNIPPEVEICIWDGSPPLACITMKDLRILLKSRVKA